MTKPASSPAIGTKFDFLPQSVVIRSDKPNKGLDAKAAANPNQTHRIVGFLSDGTKVMVSQRPGKGGMDFNKIVGGKVFAVAADGFSPVMEKDVDKKPTKVQKTEESLPLYSASGFYLLSSRDYPALDMHTAYVLLQDKGARALLLTDTQLAAKQEMVLTSDFDLDLLEAGLVDALADSKNAFLDFDAHINKKRARGIALAKDEADETEGYCGVEFKEAVANQKSGAPFVLLVWSTGAAQGHAFVQREAELVDGDGQLRNVNFSAEEAVAHIKTTKDGKALVAVVEAGAPVSVAFVQGYSVRTSVSFRRKAENVMAEAAGTPQYGDAVFVHGALRGWCKGIVAYMHSQHPNFPNADYDSHNYVAALRQAEVGMNKKPTGQAGWLPPVATHYGVGSLLRAGLALPEAAHA